ncbi:MAG: molybdenum cofactor biosynthesis protein C [Candidatus Omnitrophica bacterium CG1_02_44_16]|nr:MAG: molybdenum cofactor biosynthesis protein C [Candidatus Omnitrophica bacterium CG1_02_44_16]PIY82478.1 MAG: cyclic pyranopterin monophosphate synthase MoaC [Candidatus Omnitrophica bacterium CG_4_10_14_0_8_um_filter_44_12]PIZ84494.1 MAG: cyclic pyranopterin monophosphate synthase MoaC [Candidatus Omnitrophica bacterium CG_4_10_14_0_2_um_filter_44_9]
MNIRMVDISDKKFTKRVAVASVKVLSALKTIKKIKNGTLPKGDCLAAAQAAGILAAKNTAAMIPLCHPLSLTYVGIDFSFERLVVTITATAKASYATGVEMEALTACAAAALTIYDMAKTESKDIVITDLKLLKKSGGKSQF